MSEANSLLEASMSSNTWNTYSNGVESFKRFRTLYSLSPLWPPPVKHFTNFVAYMSYSSYSPATIRAYVSGLSFVLKSRGFEDTTQSFIIQKMIKGANKLYGRVDVTCPITMDILLKLPNSLQFVSNSMYESTMFTAAFSLSFFGLLRVGEVTVSRLSDVSKIIQITDVTFSPSAREVKIRIRYSKTDQYGKSFQICIEKADNAIICPILSLIAFIRIRPQCGGPLFCHLNKMPVTRTQFVSTLHSALRYLGYESSKYNSHSFIIGYATHLAIKGFSDDVIKEKGR